MMHTEKRETETWLCPHCKTEVKGEAVKSLSYMQWFERLTFSCTCGWSGNYKTVNKIKKTKASE